MSRDLQEGPTMAHPPIPDEGDERQTYTITAGITVYANSLDEVDAILDRLSMDDDCKYLNILDIENDEGEV